jgi:fermentation-respiration switch protein FrsA (DUF1100 family)
VIFIAIYNKMNFMDKKAAKPKLRQKKLLWIPFGVSVAAFGTALGVSLYAAYSLTKAARKKCEQKPDDFGLNHTEISFPSKDGLKLNGWWLEGSDKRRAIIMVHGANSCRADSNVKMLEIARELVNTGYNVLMFDLRGHGESEGKHLYGGYHEQRDLLGAIEYVKQLGISKIGVIGFSMGAATALMTAPYCDEIDAIVADSSFAYLADLIKPEFSKRSNLPKFLIPLVLFMAKRIHGVDLTLPKPVDAIRKLTKVPILIIHGGQDKTVPVEHASILANTSCNSNISLWFVPEAEHTGSYRARPKEYIDKVIPFLNQSLAV